jgi:hypothetical protein
MDAFKIAVKLFAAEDGFDHSEFVPVFHRWIQAQGVADHLLIDVADYAHAHHGPGTVLVSSQANIYMDRGDGRLGLLYQRKLPIEGSFAEKLRAVTTIALQLAEKLENDPALKGRLSFLGNEIVVRINDRLLAANTDETFDAIKPDLQSLAESLHGIQPVTLRRRVDPLSVLEVSLKSAAAPPIAELLARLTAPAAAH